MARYREKPNSRIFLQALFRTTGRPALSPPTGREQAVGVRERGVGQGEVSLFLNGLLEILNETTGAFILDERNNFRPAGLA